ncbi:hypothetical protein CAter282_0249 [Collimonas arenae]|uniref:Uncharacterized protein n=1 Tax=Collimonas arenae TaxID=279058 RepID=A0A127QDI8_9BURK|nr:hypothetical protein [Collimonas arenae]AMO98200.1 hypothetical protein CAter10_0263 [Collimonas arenae]AMP08071.1 hypothetical protein CAter282_0249 [Collimonas arenae]
MSAFLLDYPFADLLYPGADETIAHLGRSGRTVIPLDSVARYGLADVSVTHIRDLTGHGFFAA